MKKQRNKLTKAEMRSLYEAKIKNNPELINRLSENKKLSIFSRHPSHFVFRAPQIKLEARTSIRFGSQTTGPSKYDIELNKPAAVRQSANKLLMKQSFRNNNVKTAIWFTYDLQKKVFVNGSDSSTLTIDELPYPIVCKNIYGSRNRGNSKHDTPSQLQYHIDNNVKNTMNVIFEKFYNYATEYRIHVNAKTNKCFYNLRKMIKTDTPASERWYKNDKHCVWITEDSESGLFDKPENWGEIENHCVGALKSVGLDLGAIDLRVQSSKTKSGGKRKVRDFIVLETNSAPSFGERTAQEYLKQIKIIATKWNSTKKSRSVYK